MTGGPATAAVKTRAGPRYLMCASTLEPLPTAIYRGWSYSFVEGATRTERLSEDSAVGIVSLSRDIRTERV